MQISLFLSTSCRRRRMRRWDDVSIATLSRIRGLLLFLELYISSSGFHPNFCCIIIFEHAMIIDSAFVTKRVERWKNSRSWWLIRSQPKIFSPWKKHFITTRHTHIYCIYIYTVRRSRISPSISPHFNANLPEARFSRTKATCIIHYDDDDLIIILFVLI